MCAAAGVPPVGPARHLLINVSLVIELDDGPVVDFPHGVGRLRSGRQLGWDRIFS